MGTQLVNFRYITDAAVNSNIFVAFLKISNLIFIHTVIFKQTECEYSLFFIPLLWLWGGGRGDQMRWMYFLCVWTRTKSEEGSLHYKDCNHLYSFLRDYFVYFSESTLTKHHCVELSLLNAPLEAAAIIYSFKYYIHLSDYLNNVFKMYIHHTWWENI